MNTLEINISNNKKEVIERLFLWDMGFMLIASEKR